MEENILNYDNFAKTFSKSRKDMKWEEIDYFISKLKNTKNPLKILDIGCGSGRLLDELKKSGSNISEYLGIDLSQGMLKEARINHPGYNFMELDMLNLDKLEKNKFNCIFFIASFHHLQSIEDRLKVLKSAYNILEENSTIFMTNWGLNSKINKEKYVKSIITGSENDFGGVDYSIKIGANKRFYHCFSLEELDYLFKESCFKVVENRLFDNDKNFISIIKK